MWGRLSSAATIALAGAAVVLSLLGVLIAVHGPSGAVAPSVPWTARTSLLFFALAFALGTARGAETVAARGWLLALAVSHALHAIAIGALAVQTAGLNLAERGPLVIAGGFLSYVVIGMATLRPHSAWAGSALWLVWATFLFAYLPRVLRAPVPFAAAPLLLAAAAAMRLHWGSRPAAVGADAGRG